MYFICTVFSSSKLFSGDTITPTWTHLLHPLPSSSNLAISPHWVCSSSSLLTPLGSLSSPTQPWHSSRADKALNSLIVHTVIKAWNFQNIIYRYTPQWWIFMYSWETFDFIWLSSTFQNGSHNSVFLTVLEIQSDVMVIQAGKLGWNIPLGPLHVAPLNFNKASIFQDGL